MDAEKIKDAIINELHERVGYCGHCGKRDCAGRASNSRLPVHIDTSVVLNAIAKATP